MKRSVKAIIPAILFLFPVFSLGEIPDPWSINKKNASDPLLYTCGGKQLHLLKNLGPVFVGGDGQIGPSDYQTEVTAVEEKDGAVILKCRAVADGLKGDYTLQFKKPADGSMEMIVDGGKNVAGFQCGNMDGSNEAFKQFYIGQRDMEAYTGNDGAPPLIYWPAGKVYFFGRLDLDASHSAGYDHRLMPKKNFLAKNPPLSSDTAYGVLTDRTRPALHERYIFRAAASMWDAYGPIPTRPSEYRRELAGMIFNDVWDCSFGVETFYLDWLKNVTAGQVKFYTVVEQWGWAGFDDTLPDLYRTPDHADPAARYGTKQELKKLVDLGNSLGRTALRTNYLLIRPEASYSAKAGLAKPALNTDGTAKWHSDLSSILSLVKRQDGEFHRDFGTTAAFSDQLSSGGHSSGFINYDAKTAGAGTIGGVRQDLRDLCKAMKQIHQGPLGSESYIADSQFGEFMDTGDYQIFAADTRFDFTPEEKLRRIHPLTVTHSMGLGYRFFFGPWEKDWMAKGFEAYFGPDEKIDSYRACEILYGNGGYLFFYSGMRKALALTECFTVGVVQRHYALQPVDFVKYGKGTLWKTLDQLVTNKQIDTLDKLHGWFKRFHIRFANGCHVYVNRDSVPLSVLTPDNRTFKLPQNGWLVYTEDGNLTAYTALVSDPFFPARESRVDFCEDKARGIKFVNPRKTARYLDVAKPTVWLNGKIHFVLDDPETTFQQAFDKNRKKP
jgi:hypothetical protein